MKQSFYLLAIAILSISFASCSDDKVDEAWRDANTEAYTKTTQNPAYKELITATGPRGVYYKVIKSGEGTEHPIETSQVKVRYEGRYYDGSVFDKGSGVSGVAVAFALGGTVRGFSFAIQNMVVGDKWEVWIPYYLGYGAIGDVDPYYGTVYLKGYSTLVFDIELVDINQYP
jgi:FKBP-type peptidyl-prolyl cis-trans isomerase